MSTPFESEWAVPWSTADHHRANPDHRDQWPDPKPWLDPEPEKDTDD